MIAQYFVHKRHLDPLFAAPRLCYLVGPVDDGGRGTELVRILGRLSAHAADVLFVPVLRNFEMAGLDEPALWMNLSEPSATVLNLEGDISAVESCPPGAASVLIYISQEDNARSLEDSARRCELLRNWTKVPQLNAAEFGIFCELAKSSLAPELLSALKSLIRNAAFIATRDPELAAEFRSDIDDAETKIFCSEDKSAVTLVWALSTSLSAAASQRKCQRSARQLTETMEQLADLQFDYEKLLNASQQLRAVAKLANYRDMVRRIRQLVREMVPLKSRVLVVSKGDPELVNLENCRGLHYPQIKNGTWAGHHPINSAAAITHLENLRSEGADYFLLPAIYNWWLDHYKEFAHHLSTRYRIAAAHPEIGMLVDLQSPLTPPSGEPPSARSKSARRRKRSAGQHETTAFRKRSRKARSNRL